MKNHVAEIQDAAEDVKSHAQATGVAAAELGRATYRHLQGKATNAVQQTDRAVRSNPYVAVGISFGVGLLVGAYLSRPKAKKEQDTEEQE